MTPEQIRKFDEAVTQLNATIPSLLKSFYDKCVAEGFTPEQAISLTTVMMIQVTGGQRGFLGKD